MKTWCWFTNSLSDTRWNWTPLRIFSLEFLCFQCVVFSLYYELMCMLPPAHIPTCWQRQRPLVRIITRENHSRQFWVQTSAPLMARGILNFPSMDLQGPLISALPPSFLPYWNKTFGSWCLQPTWRKVSVYRELTQTMPALHGLGHKQAAFSYFLLQPRV